MSKFLNFFKHYRTITHHRHLVIKHCRKAGIFFQGLGHDLSKYTWIEFSSGVKYYTDGHKSPNEAERAELGYSKAWLHHKGRNKHHFEYWYDFNEELHCYMPVKMPLNYVKEMFCDRVAACKTYLKDAYTPSSNIDYFTRKETIKLLHPETGALLKHWLEMIRDVGEEETFKEIRNTKSY